MSERRIFLIAGEDSGDLHGSNLVKALHSRDQAIRVRGVGGDKLAEAGMDLMAHVKDINFMGFWEVIKNLRKIRRLFKRVHAAIDSYLPDALILIDYPGFNLRLAKQLAGRGIPIFYYISPQVWAWKKGRVKSIQQYVDHMYVILPFEKGFYAEEGVEVEFVGHPLLDVVNSSSDKQKPGNTIALLPGSRKQEIKRMLPTMLRLVPRFPGYHFIVAGAPSQEEGFYQELIQDSPVELRMNQTYEILKEADYACVTSGTATLETALFHVPQIVVYKGNPLSYAIGKRLVQVPFISLVNLILDREAVTELIQAEFNTKKLESTLRKLMDGEEEKRISEAYEELRKKLGEGGASQRVAEHILKELNKSAEISVNSGSEN